MNQGIHTLDLLLWLMGDVERVSAKAITAIHKIEVEDTVVATLEFANGAIGTLEAGTSIYPGYQRRVELSGSEGTIILEHDRIIAIDLRTPLADSVSPPHRLSRMCAAIRGSWKISCGPSQLTANQFVMVPKDGAAWPWHKRSMNHHGTVKQ
jgi:predicted dehydrogenase